MANGLLGLKGNQPQNPQYGAAPARNPMRDPAPNPAGGFNPEEDPRDKQSLVDLAGMAQAMVRMKPEERKKVWPKLADALTRSNPKLDGIVDKENPPAEGTLTALASQADKAGLKSPYDYDPRNEAMQQGPDSGIPGVSAGASNLREEQAKEEKRKARLEAIRTGKAPAPIAAPKAGKGKTAVPQQMQQDLDTGFQQAQEILGNVGEMEGLLRENPDMTGIAQPALKMARSVGREIEKYTGMDVVDEGKLRAQETFEKVNAKNVLSLAESMKGALSDKDMAFLKESTPTLSTSKEGNFQMLGFMKELAYRKIEQSLFFEMNKQDPNVRAKWQSHIGQHDIRQRSLGTYIEAFKEANPDASLQDAILFRLHQQY